jgi:hypothetical protein
MAQYYGTIQGNRGEASRIGHKTSGLHSVTNAWGIGCTVLLSWDSSKQCDMIQIYLTDGSNGNKSQLLWSGSDINQLQPVFEVQ